MATIYTNSTCTHYTRLTNLAGIVGLKLHLLDYYLKKSLRPIVAQKFYESLTDPPVVPPKVPEINPQRTLDGLLMDP